MTNVRICKLEDFLTTNLVITELGSLKFKDEFKDEFKLEVMALI